MSDEVMTKGEWARKMGPNWGKASCARCGKRTTKRDAGLIGAVLMWEDGRPLYDGKPVHSLQACPACARKGIAVGEAWEREVPGWFGPRVLRYQKVAK